jgi:hypothetical protein
MERKNILLKSHQHASGRIATDATIGNLKSREGVAHVIPPALGDRIA